AHRGRVAVPGQVGRAQRGRAGRVAPFVRGLWPYVALALVLGLAFVVIGAVMPWVVVTHADGTQHSFSGLDGSGVLTLAAALLALAGSGLGAWRWRREGRA